jgi:5-oxoprolinase (ATP-hydrolysing) subunit C
VIEILEPGIQTTVQDYPGRRGLLAKGFFPAGPMDHLAFRAANLIVGNPPDAAGLEVTLGNFAMRFEGVVAVCGAEAPVTLDGREVPMWEAHEGRELRIGAARGPGFRLYVAVAGGVDVPLVLGSRATYTMGALGGHEGRALLAGDRLPIGDARGEPRPFPARPEYARDWEIRAMRGPQSAPDFLTETDMEMLFSRSWSVNPNSNRTGTRLEGGTFEWARRSGGIAGGHPSNILDNGYPVGAVNINGDLPVILCVDGPTAGGFVVAATVIHADLWKLGQLRPVGDTVRFREVTLDEALERDRSLDELFLVHNSTA